MASLTLDALLKLKADVTGEGEIKRLQTSVTGLKGASEKASSGFGKLKTAAVALGAALASGALVGGINKIMETFGDYQADINLLENGLQNLGGKAPSYLEPLKQEASDLGELTLFNEEDFNKGFGLLTSFSEIGVDSYGRVATAAADVAQTSGTDVKSAFMQLAKALNDPVKGLTALGRSGIQFTESQKGMIEEMVNAGNVMEAQDLILKELEKQYGGNAAAAATGYAGAMDTLGEKFYDLQKAAGPLIEEALTPLVKLLTEGVSWVTTNVIPALDALPGPIKTLLGGLTALVVAIGAIAAPVALILPGLTQLGSLIGGLQIGATIAGWAGSVGPAMAAIGAAFTGFITFLTGTVLPALIGFFSGPVGWTVLAVAAVIAMVAFFREPIMNFLGWFGEKIGEAIAFLWEWGEPIREFWIGLWDIVKNAVIAYFEWWWENLNTYIVEPVANVVQAVIDFFVGMWEQIREPVMGFFEWFGSLLWDMYVQPWIDVGQWIMNAAQETWNWIMEGPIGGFFSWFGDTLYKLYIEPWQKAAEVIPAAAKIAWDFITEAVGAFFGWFSGIVDAAYTSVWLGVVKPIVQAAVDTWGSILDAVEGFFSWFVGAIKDNFIDPMLEGLKAIGKLFADTWNAVTKTVGDFLSWFGNAFLELFWNPITDLLGKVFDIFVKTFEAVREWLGSFFGWWADFFYKMFIEPIVVALEALGDLFKTVWDAIAELVGGVLEKLGQAWTSFIDGVISALGSIWDSFNKAVIEPLRRGWEDLMGLLGDLAEKAVGKIQEAWSAIVGWVNTNVVQPIVVAWEGLVGAVGQAVEQVRSVVEDVWNGIVDTLTAVFDSIATAFTENVVDPIRSAWEYIAEGISNALQGASNAVKSAWEAIAGAVLGAFKGIIGTVGRIINSIIGALNQLIKAINKVRAAVKLSPLSLIPQVNIPSFAKGGVADSPMLALVGDGGEREYLVPESKASQFSRNYLSGVRGEQAVQSSPPAALGATASSSGVARATPTDTGLSPDLSINISTGPVTEIGGERYVTVEDMKLAVQVAVKQTSEVVLNKLKQPSTRQSLGLA